MSRGGRLRAVLLALALLAGAEAALRLVYVSPSRITPHPEFGFVHDPGTRIVHGREGWAVHRTDSLGHFDDGIDAGADRRVLVVGDSFTEALGVAPEASFAAILDHDLPAVDVVGAGLSGRSPMQSAAYARHLAGRLPVDAVVLQLSDQDWEELREIPSDTGEPVEAGGTGEGAAPAAGTGVRSLVRSAVHTAVRHSALAAFTVFRVRELVAVESARLRDKFAGPGGPPPPRPPVSRTLGAVLDTLQAAAPRVVVVYVPDLDYRRAVPGPRVPGIADAYRSACEAAGAVFVDPTDALLAEFRESRRPGHGYQNSLLGEGHLNATGHRVVARVLEPAVEEALR